MFRAVCTLAVIAVIAPIVLLVRVWDDIVIAYSEDVWDD